MKKKILYKNGKMYKTPKEILKGSYRSVNLYVIQGDITDENVDAIVNAANEYLAHGGGVAGAISSRGGRDVQRESDEYVREHGPVHTGFVGLTGPGRLKCKKIIHAVGPVFHGGNAGEDEDLESAVYQSFLKAHELRFNSISIPAISSGIFGFPKPRCAKIMIRTAKKFIDEFPDTPLKNIRFTNFDNETASLMQRELQTFLKNPTQEIVLGTIEKKNKDYFGGWFGGSSENKKEETKRNQSAEEKKLQEIVGQKPREKATSTEEVKPKEEERLSQELKPTDVVKLGEEVKPNEEVKLGLDIKPTEEAKLSEEVEVKPSEEIKPTEEVKPCEEVEVKPSEVIKPTEEVKPSEKEDENQSIENQDYLKIIEEAKNVEEKLEGSGNQEEPKNKEEDKTIEERSEKIENQEESKNSENEKKIEEKLKGIENQEELKNKEDDQNIEERLERVETTPSKIEVQVISEAKEPQQPEGNNEKNEIHQFSSNESPEAVVGKEFPEKI